MKSVTPIHFRYLSLIFAMSMLAILFVTVPLSIHLSKRDAATTIDPINKVFINKRLINRIKDDKKKGTNILINNQEANESELQRELHQHFEEESEDWWEVQRSYEYQTADSLGDLFLVEVEEAQVIHKQHAQLDDVQRAENFQTQKASQDVLNINDGLQKGTTNANSTTIAAEEIQQHQREDLLEVKQYQKIHVVQVNLFGLLKNEYEEERLVQYEYSLSIDAFNQWEYSSSEDNQSADNLVFGNI
ncbi:8765_t:CDS:1 [Ambispora gerdemannii]|uniref:8765_t:CDS:1 n=1 Tax=Ambispora gerdemannii TaxID=144530 RepID=A0A9N9H296_9GLOM|nr:8765_t:CDS:1 [Ambispora gerdemannii]